MEVQINWMAIIIATIANFIIGALWYMPLFGKAWGNEMKMDMTQKPDNSVMIKGMLFMVIGNFLTAYVLAHNVAAWRYVPGMTDMGPIANTISTAVFTWLGFFVPYHLGAIVWENRSWKLFFINVGYSLVALLVISAILIFMQ